MNNRMLTISLIAASAMALATGSAAAGASAAAPASGHHWGTAKEVPGTAALDKGGNAIVSSVSCGSAGNCSAGGGYTDISHSEQAFVVSEQNGTWRFAKEAPGTAALNKGGSAILISVSCRSAGNCSAGGDYTDGSGHAQVFVISQKNGTWSTAREVPGSAALNKGGFGNLASVSCGSPGNCSAGGDYADASQGFQAFVVSEQNGTWRFAKEVPGTATLNKGGNATITWVSCATAGNCGAGGNYTDKSGHLQAFVVSEKNGTWGTAEEVPATATLNKGGNASVASVSCASAGNCSAGGNYTDGSHHSQAFVVSEKNGTWEKAEEVPGTATLNKGGHATITSISCPSAGNCGAGGTYQDSFSLVQVYVVSQTNGNWGNAGEMPGTSALNIGGIALITSVSCASAGNCAAGGRYTDTFLGRQAFVDSEK